MGRGLKAYSLKWRFCHWLSLMSRMTDGLLWNTKGEICPKAKTLMWFEQKGDGFLWITSWISIWASFFGGGGDSLCAALYGKCTMKCISPPFVLYWRNKSYRFGLTWGWVNDDRIYIFGWTIPLSTVMSHVGFIKAISIILVYIIYIITPMTCGVVIYITLGLRNGSPVYFGNWVEVQVLLAAQHKPTYFLKQQCGS